MKNFDSSAVIRFIVKFELQHLATRELLNLAYGERKNSQCLTTYAPKKL